MNNKGDGQLLSKYTKEMKVLVLCIVIIALTAIVLLDINKISQSKEGTLAIAIIFLVSVYLLRKESGKSKYEKKYRESSEILFFSCKNRLIMVDWNY